MSCIHLNCDHTKIRMNGGDAYYIHDAVNVSRIECELEYIAIMHITISDKTLMHSYITKRDKMNTHNNLMSIIINIYIYIYIYIYTWHSMRIIAVIIIKKQNNNKKNNFRIHSKQLSLEQTTTIL